MLRSFLNSCHERWANLHPLFRLFCLALLLAGTGWCVVKPGYGAFKAWRLEKNLSAARKAVTEDRMVEARDFSLTVLRAGDPRIDAYRILEKSTRALGDNRHDDIALALMSHSGASSEDRLTGFRSVAADMPLGLVGQAWVSLGPDIQKDPRFAVTFGERLISEKRLKEAASMLQEVPEEKRDAALNRSLIRVLIRSGRTEGYDEAQRLISSGFSTGTKDAPDWLDLLEEIPPLSLSGKLLAPIRPILEDQTAVDVARRALMLARIDYAAEGSDHAEIVAQAVAKWKDAAPGALARFLGDLGLHRQLLEVYPPEGAGDHPQAFMPLLTALEKTDEWKRVPSVLDAHADLIPKFEALAHRAIAIAKTADAAGPNQSWLVAVDEAKSNQEPSDLLKLHRIAAELGMPEEANLALVEAIRLGHGPLPLFADLKPLMASLQQRERENNLLEICAIYLQFEPANPVLLTQYAYLACLNDLAAPATILKTLEPMARTFPKEAPMQCVLAAIYLYAGQPAKAAETLDPLGLDPSLIPPSYRVTLLATRVLCGRMTASDPLIQEFPWKSLLPSERRKFSELIRNAKP